MNVIYWLNIEWADGTESTFEDSAHFKSKSTAIGRAAQKHTDCGCPVYVIGNGTVVAAYRDGKRVDELSEVSK